MNEQVSRDRIVSFEPGLGIEQLRAQDEFAPGVLVRIKRELFLPLLAKLRNVENGAAGERRDGKMYVISAMISLSNSIRPEELTSAEEGYVRAEIQRRGDLLLQQLLGEREELAGSRAEYASGMKSAIDLFIGRLSVLVLIAPR